MIHHILYLFSRMFYLVQKFFDDLIDLVSDKAERLIYWTLWFVFVFPFWVLQRLFEILVELCRIEKNYKKNIKEFRFWYYNQRGKNETDNNKG